jgi:uncharacterized cupin superfamily protein
LGERPGETSKVGDRSDGDVVTYPDVDMHLIRGQGMFHKDGRKY